MTVGEVALLIGLLINAGAIIFVAWFNNRKFSTVISDVHKIELSTNSMKDKIVEATTEAVVEAVAVAVTEAEIKK